MTVSTDVTRDDVLQTLRAHVTTHVALPGEPGYERCMAWNVAAQVAPAAETLGLLASIATSSPFAKSLVFAASATTAARPGPVSRK